MKFFKPFRAIQSVNTLDTWIKKLNTLWALIFAGGLWKDKTESFRTLTLKKNSPRFLVQELSTTDQRLAGSRSTDDASKDFNFRPGWTYRTLNSEVRSERSRLVRRNEETWGIEVSTKYWLSLLLPTTVGYQALTNCTPYSVWTGKCTSQTYSLPTKTYVCTSV